jgi:hypothetical protein
LNRNIVARGEWIWLLAVSVLILLFSTLPYLEGYFSQTSDSVFSGAVFDRMDFSVHMATMRLGAHGDWAYQFRFTSEPHASEFVKLFYIVLGQVAGWLHLDPELTYQLARWVFGFTALLLIYRLMAAAFEGIIIRRASFLIAVLGSGLGWLQLIAGWQPNAGISPIDYWLMDAYVFFSLMIFPHYMAVLSLIIGMILLFLNFLRSGKHRSWLLSSFMGLGIIAIQPFSVLLGILGMGGAILGRWSQNLSVKWSDLGVLFRVVALQLPLLLYNLYVYQTLPVWSEIGSQHIMLSPPLLNYLFGFGLLWPLAVWGGLITLRKRLPVGFIALIWVIGALVLCYFPLNFQRRFIFSLVVPLSMLCGYSLEYGVLPRLGNRSVSLLIILIPLLSLTSFHLLFGSTYLMTLRSAEYFEPSDLIDAIKWLDGHAAPDDVVLAAEQTSQTVAASTGLRVYSGHPMETQAYEAKRDQVIAFFSGEHSGTAIDKHVRWVIYGPHERELSLGSEWSPPGDFQQVYENQEVSIYQRTYALQEKNRGILDVGRTHMPPVP